MRVSQYFLATVREIASHVNVISYQLMLRAGLIRQVSSGLYTWLPSGLRVLRKIENIIRQEMNKIGGVEIILPIVQPGILWKRSGRWEEYGLELLKFKNRNNQDFVLGPTHEELISEMIYKELISCKQLPLILYQIQNKFRDEIRPRFGVIRSREFIMKDGYSFHASHQSLQDTYGIMYHAYHNIFSMIGLNFSVIEADSGNIGGNISHEFHAIVNSGESTIVCSTGSNYSSSIHLAEFMTSTCDLSHKDIMEDIRLVQLFNTDTVMDLVNKYNLSEKNIVQTLVVHANKNFGSLFVALLIRLDHKLNYSKVERLPQVSVPLTFVSADEIHSMFNVNASVLGPINLPIPCIADRDVASMTNFISGANISNSYFFGVNWGRDLPFPLIADMRQVMSGDISPDGKGILKISNSVEIGHIFQLGTKYLDKIRRSFCKDNQKFFNVEMGCYGIGISRIIAAIIEQNNDRHGIVWPIDMLAPFFIAIIPINMKNFFSVAKVAEKLYNQFSMKGIDVLLDDRGESPGVMFSDIELIGIPHVIIVSNQGLSSGEVEYQYRRSNEKLKIKLDKILDFLLQKII